jgi:hypothetical protein
MSSSTPPLVSWIADHLWSSPAPWGMSSSVFMALLGQTMKGMGVEFTRRGLLFEAKERRWEDDPRLCLPGPTYTHYVPFLEIGPEASPVWLGVTGTFTEDSVQEMEEEFGRDILGDRGDEVYHDIEQMWDIESPDSCCRWMGEDTLPALSERDQRAWAGWKAEFDRCWMMEHVMPGAPALPARTPRL